MSFPGLFIGGVRGLASPARRLRGIDRSLRGVTGDHGPPFGRCRGVDGLGQHPPNLGEAVPLLEPDRGGVDRAGGHGVAVPSPQRALSSDQPLTLVQAGLQAFAVGVIGDDTDLRQPAFQRRRTANKIGERLRAVRKRRRVRRRGQCPPVHRRGIVGGCGKIVAECRRERDLHARIDGDGVEHRCPLIRVPGLDHLGQGSFFGAEARHRAFGGLKRGNGGR